jgi:hypothetical protein
VRDAGLLRGGRGVNVAKDRDEIALRPIRAIDEGEDTDEQGEKRDEPEEDLIGDRAGEEGAIVVREALDDRAAARNSAG